MRPARPDQDATVSTTIATTIPELPPGEVSDSALAVINTPVTTSPALAVSTSVVAVPTTRGGAAGVASTAPHDDVESVAVHALWDDGGEIDVRFTCDGDNVSPGLSWEPAPEGTVEIAITVTDADAPGFVHWAVAAIDPLSTALGEGRVPEFAIEAMNSGGTPGYTGPCPPEGETHTYDYTVSFLGQQTEVADGSAGEVLLADIRAKAFESATVSGTYSRA
jgi:hypothetical protein